MPVAERREQILDAALQLIIREGYQAVTIEAVARQLDVTRPVIYNAFDGLGPLLNALLDRQEGRALDQLLSTVSARPGRDELAEYVRRTVADLVAMVTTDPATWTPILLAGVDTPVAVRARIDRDREMIRQRFGQLAGAALGRRAKAAGLDVELVAHALLALAEYFGRLVLEQPGMIDADRLARTVTALVLPATPLQPTG